MLGNKINIKYLILIVIFLSASIATYGFKKEYVVSDKSSIESYFREISGFDRLDSINMPSDALNMLDLSDYIFSNYSHSDNNINLYIGYYYTADKAYASHSPLICYPSQGWRIQSKPTKGQLRIGSEIINFEEIIASLGERKELVIYWYQARLQTNTQIYKNKLDMGYNKFLYNDEQHGFVRISVPLKNLNYKEAKELAMVFIKAFYPQFVVYILN